MEQEGRFLHFLRTFPLWLITIPLFIFNACVYLITIFYVVGASDVFKELTYKSFDAILLSIGIRIAQYATSPTPNQTNAPEGNQTVINLPPKTDITPSETQESKPIEDITSTDVNKIFDTNFEEEKP